MKKLKQVFMIGGPNGAGKTTSAFMLMPELIDCYEYINADSIAASLSPFNPDALAIKSGRLMLERIKELSSKEHSFAFETTMASKSFVTYLTKFKEQGYEINLLYIWLVTPELAVQRVQRRVESGGHNIPIDVIIRRYHRSMRNFIYDYIPLADRWILCDNSDQIPNIVAQKYKRHPTFEIYNEEIWRYFNKVPT